jgi:hypothetical protein
MAALLIAWATASAASARATTLTEEQKIEMLIRGVDGLADAVFIRNGKRYDCHAAAQHMREKWQWKRAEIRTARDFIRVAASTSSQTGQPYLIRFKDGHEVNSGDFLSSVLDKIENAPAK